MILTSNSHSLNVTGLEAVSDRQTGAVYLTLPGTHDDVPVVAGGKTWNIAMTECYMPVGSRRWVKHQIATEFLTDDCDAVEWDAVPEQWRQRIRRLVFGVDGALSSRLEEEPTVLVEGDRNGRS